jgi:hypothetical protein
MLIHGGCHCGSITFELTWDPTPSDETRTATFHVCGRCGIVPVVTSEIDGRLYAVVSVNAFNDVQPSVLRRAPVSFDGEDEATRLARRKRNWIPDVRFVGRGA